MIYNGDGCHGDGYHGDASFPTCSSINISEIFLCVGRNSSMWYIPGKEEASQLIEKLNPHCSDAVELVSGVCMCVYVFVCPYSMYPYSSATGTPPKVPDPVQDILMNNGIFWQYPQLLPEIGFG